MTRFLRQMLVQCSVELQSYAALQRYSHAPPKLSCKSCGNFMLRLADKKKFFFCRKCWEGSPSVATSPKICCQLFSRCCGSFFSNWRHMQANASKSAANMQADASKVAKFWQIWQIWQRAEARVQRRAAASWTPLAAQPLRR